MTSQLPSVVLTTEQSFYLATIESRLETSTKAELIATLIEVLKAYYLADNFRKIVAADILLGVKSDEPYLQKYSKTTFSERIEAHLKHMESNDN